MSTQTVKLPMVCRHGPSYEAAADEMVADALEIYNTCGDWLETDELTVDLLMYAFAMDGYSVEMYGDMWFGLSLKELQLHNDIYKDVTLFRVECDTILDGLVALYLASRKTDADAG